MSKGGKILLVVLMGLTMMSLNIIDFISKINNQTIKKIDYLVLTVAFFSILVLSYITWLQLKGDKTNEELVKENQSLKGSLGALMGQLETNQEILKKVNFGRDKSYDEQFLPIFEQMKEDPNREISILNYTQTGFPKNYANYFSKLISQIIKTYRKEFDYKNQYVTHDLFIDWKNIMDDLEIIINNGKLNSEQFKKYLGVNNKNELEQLIIKNIKDSSNSLNRDKYLIAESYWLLPDNSGDKVTRMYYLNPDSDFEHLTDRFLFSCSTMINCMFSSRYKIALLPARIKNPYSDNITSYQVLHGLSFSGDTMTPQSWVFSGIKTNEAVDDKLDYIFIQCKDNSDAIIGTKGSHTLGYLNSIWRKLEKNELVLFDGTTLYLKRICELAFLIAKKAGNTSQKARFKEKFDVFLREVNEINSFVNIIINCQLGLINEIQVNSMWYVEDIINYNKFLSQDKIGCNMFINCDKDCSRINKS